MIFDKIMCKFDIFSFLKKRFCVDTFDLFVASTYECNFLSVLSRERFTCEYKVRERFVTESN